MEKDQDLPKVTQDLLKTLDKIAEEAPHAADPRVLLAQFASDFAAYLRTPD